jgi:hypothetical protein
VREGLVVLAQGDDASISARAIHHGCPRRYARRDGRSREHYRLTRSATGENLKGRVGAGGYVEDITWSRSVGRRLETLKRTASRSIATATARDDIALSTGEDRRKFGPRGARLDSHFSTPVRVLQCHAEIVSRPRLQKHCAGGVVVETQGGTIDFEIRVGPHRGRSRHPGAVALPAKLQQKGAVQVVIVGY